jgi:putative hydrolase of the HAD superfamily
MTHMKPHREAFLATCSALGVAPQSCVFVGDRPRDDVLGAKAVGMRAVLMSGRPVPPAEVEPDAVLTDLRDLVGLVDGWRG